MALREDLQALTQLWVEGSVLARVFSGASLLLSALSLGSLADAVFQFKGFVAQALDVYRALTATIIEWMRIYFDIEITQMWFDATVVGILCVSSVVRSAVGLGENRFFAFYAAIGIALVVVQAGFLLTVFTSTTFGSSIGTVVGLAITLPSVLLMFAYGSRNHSDFSMACKIACINVVGLYLLVAVVIAIIEGATRPLAST